LTRLDLRLSIPIFAIGFIGAFLANIVRLLVICLTFFSFGVDAGVAMHVYSGYVVFVVWVLAF
jgi:exosortase/archaeosortase family protein